ncbi:MAG: hypothetical protein HY226_05995 [Candidatus Vogelbacteria bacterium]|nr:hypothetical protein [Candidatus Vogelbacteria bacterium]
MTIESVYMGPSRKTTEVIISKEKSAKWDKRAYDTLEKIEMPGKLREWTRPSLETPQLGPYHNEAIELSGHIGRIMEVTEDIKEGRFNFYEIGLPKELADEAKIMIERAVRANYESMNLYALEHDRAKHACMNIEDNQKKQRIFTLEEWRALVAENGGDKEKAQQALIAQGYTKIGYRISKELAKANGQEERDHGDEAEKMLVELGESDPEVKTFVEQKMGLIMKAITNHEMHFQVFNQSKSASRYEKSLKEKFSQEEIDFIFAVCFIDIAGSLNKEGKSDYTGFQNMVNSKRLYDIVSNCGLQNTEPLRNLGTEADVLAKIEQLRRDEIVREAMKNMALGPEDVVAMESMFDVWGVKSSEDKSSLSEAINKSLGQNNPLDVINRSLPNNLKRYSKSIKQYLETKIK